jgi:hypothetical protein
MRACRRFVAGAVVGLGLLVAVPAGAQPEPLPGDRAVAFAQEGLKHYEAGAWAEALDKFEKAEAASHSAVFVLYVARAQRSLGKLLAARETYKKLVAEKLPDDALASWRQAQADGRGELAALEPSIPSVVVSAPGASAAARVVVGDRPAEVGKPLEVDPGNYKIVIVDGDRRAEAQVEVRPGERERQVALAFGGPVGTGPGPGPGPNPPVEEAQTEGSLAPGIALLAVGGAGLIAGAVLGGLALKMDGDIKETCPELECPAGTVRAAVEDDRSTMLTMADASTGLLIAGGVVAATGLVLVIVRPGGSDAQPAVSAGPTRVQLAWRF